MEMLVVIAIISILASILLPALNSAKKAVKEKSCASNLKQIGMGIQMYSDDHSSFVLSGDLKIKNGELDYYYKLVK